MVRLSGSRAGAKKSGRISASLEDIVPFADAAERRHRPGKKKRKWGSKCSSGCWGVLYTCI